MTEPENHTLLSRWQEVSWPVVKSFEALPMGEGVLDETAFNVMEIDKLFDVVNHASTTIGQAVIYRSIARPLSDVKAIQAKQDAVKELKDNPQLRGQIEQLVANAAQQETHFYTLLYGHFIGAFSYAQKKNEIEGYGYRQYRHGIRFVTDLITRARTVDQPKSAYLKTLFENIATFTQTRYYSLMEGPVYVVEGKIKTKAEQGDSKFPIPVIFKPTIFKPFLLISLIFLAWFLSLISPFSTGLSIPTLATFAGPLLLLYFPVIGGYDRDSCIIPLRNLFKKAEPVAELLDTLGQIDELLAFIKFAESFPHATVLPKLEVGKHHRINLTAAVNPVLGHDNKAYVANDFVLEDEKLVLLTGPNSGGKTAFCKTVTQIQTLAQIGCYVTAKSATITAADRIYYQVPEISHLDDGEGRFGTELKRTKAIFLATTARSLVVLDELSEGTTFEEKMEASANTLNGFYRKGNSTVLITHNHQLVDQFVEAGTGVPLQVEFAKELPTFRLVPGISRVSHADRVAKKIGFSKADIDKYLADSE
jgi:DNA mismatch repair protein MutS